MPDRLRTGAGSTGVDHPSPVAGAHGGAGTVVALCLALALGCAHRQGPTDLPRDGLTRALDALERKVCLTIGERTNGPGDQCEPQVDRSTYLGPLEEVFLAAPPILKAYLCSPDRLYFDYHSPWNESFSAFPDSQTGREYRSIAVRRGVLENKVPYSDAAKGMVCDPPASAVVLRRAPPSVFHQRHIGRVLRSS